MAVRDTWNRALVYFGLAEDQDYGPEYDDEFEPETGTDRYHAPGTPAMPKCIDPAISASISDCVPPSVR